jgi:hypothetical protein
MERRLGAKVKREISLEDELKEKKIDLQLMFYGDSVENISLLQPSNGHSWKQFLENYFNKSKKNS